MTNELEQTVCKRCGKKLKSSKAIELGMGAICWKKYISEKGHKALWKEKNTD